MAEKSIKEHMHLYNKEVNIYLDHYIQLVSDRFVSISIGNRQVIRKKHIIFADTLTLNFAKNVGYYIRNRIYNSTLSNYCTCCSQH